MTRERQEWKPSWRDPGDGYGVACACHGDCPCAGQCWAQDGVWDERCNAGEASARFVGTNHGAWRPPDEDRITSLLRRMWQLVVCEGPNHGFDARTYREVGLDVRVFGARARIVRRDETSEAR